MAFNIDWNDWLGAAGMAVISDYAKGKMKQLSSRIDNATLVDALSLFVSGYGMRMGAFQPYMRGAASYGAGQLASTYISSKLISTASAVIPTTTKSSTTALPASTGTPSSGGSAIFDQTVAGY